MRIIHTSQRSKNVKRKPGWQAEEAAYQAWLDGVNSQKFSKRPPHIVPKPVDPVVRQPVIRAVETAPSRVTPGANIGKRVERPELRYRDNEEMLQRELKARERKFNVAPAYNKGADQLVTEEQLTAVLSTNKRR